MMIRSTAIAMMMKSKSCFSTYISHADYSPTATKTIRWKSMLNSTTPSLASQLSTIPRMSRKKMAIQLS